MAGGFKKFDEQKRQLSRPSLGRQPSLARNTIIESRFTGQMLH
jgi:hypothetical protein